MCVCVYLEIRLVWNNGNMPYEKLNAMRKDKIIVFFSSYPSVKGKKGMQ